MMRSTKKVSVLRTAVAAVGLGIASIGMVVVLAAPAGAQTATIKVKPDTGLKNKETVVVSGKNLTASTEVAILECQSTATSEAGCYVSGVVLAETSASGKLAKTDFTVLRKFTDEGGSKVNCKVADSCAVVVGYVVAETDAGAVPISFS
jgi:hypothetical protein